MDIPEAVEAGRSESLRGWKVTTIFIVLSVLYLLERGLPFINQLLMREHDKIMSKSREEQGRK